MMTPCRMTRTVLPVVLIALLAMMTGIAVSGAAGQQIVTVTVTVVDQNNSPVANAQLEATWEGGSATAVTKSNGKAFLDVPEGADVQIGVDHASYTRNLPYKLTGASGDEITIDVAEKAAATITVVDDDGPVRDARVRFWKGADIIVSEDTDSDGELYSGVIEAGNYRVTVTEQGYYRESIRLDVQGEIHEEVQLEHGTVTVTFLVQDENFHPPKPVAQAEISGDEIGTVRTQPNGVQQVSIPVNSQVEVTVQKDGYQSVTETIAVDEENTEIEISTRKNPAISFGFLNDRVVVGEQVYISISDQYGDPVEDARIFLDGNPIGQTDENGILLVEVEEPGDHTFYAEFESFSSQSHTVTGVLPMEQGESSSDSSDDAAADTPPDTPAAVQSGMVSVPGLSVLHLESTGIGVAIGAALVLAVTLVLRLRRPSQSD